MGLRPLRDAVGTWSPAGVPAPQPIHAIAAAWPAIVGPEVAKNTRPLELSGTALVVATRSSAWSQQLQMLSLHVLRGLAAVPHVPPVQTLRFRVGRVAERSRRAPPDAPKPSGGRVPSGPAPGPAADPAEALERVRRRIAAVRRSALRGCAACGAPIDAGDAQTCAPCTQDAERARTQELERLIYAAPWLDLAEVREQLPHVNPGEYERARRSLLARWGHILERVRRSPQARPTSLERMTASSYVLLHARMRPERMTPAVVRNLLGDDLVARLWPERTDKATGVVSSKKKRQ